MELNQSNTLTAQQASDDVTWTQLRAIRDNKLRNSDKIVVQVLEQGGAISEQWKNYRQALRDLPQNTEDPRAISWPQEP